MNSFAPCKRYGPEVLDTRSEREMQALKRQHPALTAFNCSLLDYFCRRPVDNGFDCRRHYLQFLFTRDVKALHKNNTRKKDNAPPPTTRQKERSVINLSVASP